MVRGSGPRMTLPTRLVLQAMLDEPTQEMYGLQIGRKAGLPSGTIHPILARFEEYGWLESRWEDIDPGKEGRPRRRYYRLSPDGIEYASAALARAQAHSAAALARVRAQASASRLDPWPAGGVP